MARQSPVLNCTYFLREVDVEIWTLFHELLVSAVLFGVFA